MEVNFPKLEEKVLKRWREEKTFEKSVARRAKGPRFVFYDGPPTANAGPGLHHMVNRVFKDVILRYKTMQGFFVPRRAGWDTHGLPVELQIEKKLGLKSKKDIEKYGIAKFNAESKKSVWEYKSEWERFNERVGLWIDMEHPYITYETPYIETLWAIIKKFADKKLLYKDYKVVPYCTRCGTPLSSHELAQGYKTVKEPAVYVKFWVKSKKFPAKTSFLAWTTTPWTLPGNVALAVHPNLLYVVARKEGKHYVVAKDLAGQVLGEHEVVKILKGKELVGTSYEPPFKFKSPEKGKKAWEVVPASFVLVQEGTGIVHTAVAYGADDFELGKKENLAMLHVVDEQGKFEKEATPFKGMFVKDADPLIVQDLKKRNLLFKEELYEHEYPFCWRCSTPLLYYAKESWFLNMQKVKKNLLLNNESVNWVPSHIKKGRMGEWLKEVKDWAFSRDRYWGTPLPVWECSQCNEREVIGSLEQLRKQKFTTNTFIILRHGDAQRPLDIMSSWPEKKEYHLTPKGKKQIEKIAKELKKKRIDLIFSSDFLRTRETAEIVGNALGIKPLYDKRLREFDVGTLNGKNIKELGKIWGRPGESEEEHYLRRFVDPMPKGESWSDAQRRMVGFVRELAKKYQNKRILIIGHELPLTLLEGTMRGLLRKDIIRFRKQEKKYLRMGEWRELPFAQLPFDEGMELNLHRPYVDEIVFACAKCKKGRMQRVKEVVDVWFDSGAMPFAQNHWMAGLPKEFPADYIVEAIDQTRGWFYTLLAVSTLLGFKTPYRNVISLAHVLDKKGEKMSKSKGNVVNPWDIANKYGVDASRWYFFTVNNPGDPKLFSEKDIQQATRRFLLTLWNSFVFFETYRVPRPNLGVPRFGLGRNVLDQWIMSRLNTTIGEMTRKMNGYDITGAARTLEGFVVNDLSLWYIRRSRSRVNEAGPTLGFVLSQTCKLAAPFTPFLSEYMYEELGNKESVHLTDWPKVKTRNAKLETQMVQVRDVVAKALAERAKAGIKVRQPLASLKVKDTGQKIPARLLSLIQDEVNIKRVVFDRAFTKEVDLDIHLTPELKEEGLVRELLRNIQDLRKEAGYKPGEKAVLYYEGKGELIDILEKNQSLIAKNSNIQKFVEGKVSKLDKEKQVLIENTSLWFGIRNP